MAVEDINLNQDELDGSFKRLDKNVPYYFVSIDTVLFFTFREAYDGKSINTRLCSNEDYNS